MSDNEDLLGDDLGDQSLADYNLGNEEEEQLLADDYDNAGPQNVPSSLGPSYRDIAIVSPDNSYNRVVEYSNTILPYEPPPETESVVPNVNVDVPEPVLPPHTTYAPYEPPYEEHTVPPTMPAGPQESPQIVPSDVNAPVPNGDLGGPRERFVSERPPGAQRLPQVRDIPDSLDKVVIPRGGFGRARTSWRSPHFAARFAPPYRRYPHNNRGNFNQRLPYPGPQQLRTMNSPPLRPENRPEMRPELRPEPHPEMRPDIRPDMRPEPPNMPQMGPEISPERPILPQEIPMYRPNHERPPYYPRFQFRPNMEERPPFNQVRPNFEPRPVFYRPNFPPRQYAPPMREIVPNSTHMPQVTIRQALPGPSLDKPKDLPREPEVRMLPVALPPNLPPGGLAGKKVLINPHFKGNFQPPVEGLPVYIPTRIQKSPPLSPTIESKFGPVKDIDDAAERFIAEQRNALARAAVRKYARRSPQRYIENTTIEIENELALGQRRGEDEDLLRRQEEFINANRAGLRRRMRSGSPARRSLSPRRSPERRPRHDPPRHADEDSDYKRKMREQESLRERVLKAKEVRRRKNAVAMHKQLQDKERETQEKDKEVPPPATTSPPALPAATTAVDATPAPAAAAASPPGKDNSQTKDEGAATGTTAVENLTPPHNIPIKRESTERALTPPLPEKRTDSDDDLDLILGDIDGILSDDEDTGRFKDKTKEKKSEPPKSKPQVDLRSKLPPKAAEHKKPQRQKIVFEDREDGKSKKKEKSPPRRAVVTSSIKTDENEPVAKKPKVKPKLDLTIKSRARITYDNKEQVEKDKDDEKQAAFSNRRVILQRKTTKDKSVFSRIEVKADPTKPNPGIFSRAVRTAIGSENTRIVVKKDEPQVQFESDSDIDEDTLLEESGSTASVANLPHGMTDTRLKTLAGNEVQSLSLDKEERTAKITFKTPAAAEGFKKKFNNKMVAASRLSVTLR